MKTKFTRTFMRENRGCYDLNRVNSLAFMKKKEITLQDIIKSRIPFRDKIWFIWIKCNFNFDQRVECWEGSKELQRIYPYRWVFSFSVFGDYCGSDGLVGLPDQKVVLEELLKYSKKKSS